VTITECNEQSATDWLLIAHIDAPMDVKGLVWHFHESFLGFCIGMVTRPELLGGGQDREGPLG
jgi:hypothetical protein